jgi:hypothetical protein
MENLVDVFYLLVLDTGTRMSDAVQIDDFVLPDGLLGRSVDQGTLDAIRRLVGVPLQRTLRVLVHQTPVKNQTIKSMKLLPCGQCKFRNDFKNHRP